MHQKITSESHAIPFYLTFSHRNWPLILPFTLTIMRSEHGLVIHTYLWSIHMHIGFRSVLLLYCSFISSFWFNLPTQCDQCHSSVLFHQYSIHWLIFFLCHWNDVNITGVFVVVPSSAASLYISALFQWSSLLRLFMYFCCCDSVYVFWTHSSKQVVCHDDDQSCEGIRFMISSMLNFNELRVLHAFFTSPPLDNIFILWAVTSCGKNGEINFWRW